jgi:hypothetical protein
MERDKFNMAVLKVEGVDARSIVEATILHLLAVAALPHTQPVDSGC